MNRENKLLHQFKMEGDGGKFVLAFCSGVYSKEISFFNKNTKLTVKYFALNIKDYKKGSIANTINQFRASNTFIFDSPAFELFVSEYNFTYFVNNHINEIVVFNPVRDHHVNLWRKLFPLRILNLCGLRTKYRPILDYEDFTKLYLQVMAKKSHFIAIEDKQTTLNYVNLSQHKSNIYFADSYSKSVKIINNLDL